MANQEAAIKRALADGNMPKAREEYDKYRHSMERAGQKPRDASSFGVRYGN